MLAGKTVIQYLIDHEAQVYSHLAELGNQVRHRLETIFADHGILARCTGYPNEAVSGSSLAMLHFPVSPDIEITSPDIAADPTCCMFKVREYALKLALLLNDVYAVHGLGALSTSHTQNDLEHLYQACDAAAERFAEPLAALY
jgi:glutamate-1-semialdehyde aminotransferase